MNAPLLTTKFYPPPSGRTLIPRGRLVERLNAGLEARLTLVCAPAGFGKTTVVSAWARQSGRRVAWLSLDENDNETARFLTYLITALQGVDERLGADILAALKVAPAPQVELLLTMLVNDVAGAFGETAPAQPSAGDQHSDEHFTLVLDDYHVITAQPIHDAVAFLLDHQPPHMHLIIASRDDPFLPLSRLRARGELVEIRAADMRFTDAEATAFLNQVMGLALSQADVVALGARTEGWIAGLHLAALSLQSRLQRGEDPTRFISAFAGNDRYIVDYLVDEVLARQSPATVDFLMQTSILDRLNGPLCEAVTGQPGGLKVLQQLEQANLFIVPLDNRRHWYRYHHLFADVLRQRLAEAAPPAEIRLLHQRASRWYAANEAVVEAIEHALRAEDYAEAIRLIYQFIGWLFMHSQMDILVEWRSRLPTELLRAEPKLYMVFTWAHIATGHPQAAEACLQTIEREMGAPMALLFEPDRLGELPPAARAALLEIAVARAQLAIGSGQVTDALRLTQRAITLLEDQTAEGIHFFNPLDDLRPVVYFISGSIQKELGDLEAAEAALLSAIALAQVRSNVHIVAAASGALANVQSLRGRLGEAVDACRNGLRAVEAMIGSRTPLSSLMHAELGSLLYEQNDLEAALEQIQAGISLAKPWGYWEGLLPSLTGLALIRAAQGDWQAAYAALDELAALGDSVPHLVPIAQANRARLLARQGDTERAQRWAQAAGLDPQSTLDYPREYQFIALARVYLAGEQWAEADRLIDRLLAAMEPGGRWGRVIELLALKAVARDRLADPEAAAAALGRALALAEPRGYVRVFLDAGPGVARLIYQALERGAAPAYAGRLLAAFSQPESGVRPPSSPPASQPPGMVEPLSEREIEVLHLIAAGLTNQEIAQRLYLSPGTIKIHAHNIYGKLGVGSRTLAVAKARELGLLPRA